MREEGQIDVLHKEREKKEEGGARRVRRLGGLLWKVKSCFQDDTGGQMTKTSLIIACIIPYAALEVLEAVIITLPAFLSAW